MKIEGLKFISQKQRQMIHQCIKRGSTFLVVKEMQINYLFPTHSPPPQAWEKLK
jgi:hypothetical protein